MQAISLFSCAGVGDLGLRESGIQTIIANELIKDRAKIFSANFPETDMIVGDIWEVKDEIIEKASNYEIDLLFATPPCQGMSSNGAGMLMKNREEGLIPKLDPRNRLILPTIEICQKVLPKFIIFENVRGMKNTLIENVNGELVNILNEIKDSLEEYYEIEFHELNFANFGLAQTRTRLITIAVRKDLKISVHDLNPSPTHEKKGSKLEKWVTLGDVIGHMPTLDSASPETAIDDNDPLHRVSTIPKEKYAWVANAKYGDTAFNNQCINPDCLFDENRKHSVERINGRRHASTSTPIDCEKCGSPLPRPTLIENGKRRLIKGFPDAYKRMKWEDPGPTLTRNLLWLSSEKKLHPTQNRTLSIREAMMLQSISDHDFTWLDYGDTVIADCIGESVPPRIVSIICRPIINLDFD